MIEFISLTLQGFRSFKDEQTLVFPTDPQFILVTGKNKVQPSLSGNATGKTSLLASGLTWTLYGKTERGLTGPQVANWDREHLTRGSVALKRGKNRYVILRTWKPNTLTLTKNNGKPKIVTQDRIDRLLGCNYEAYIGLVLMGQFNSFFFDLSPTEKLQVFSNAMRLEYWVERADKAKSLARDAEQAIDALDRDLAAQKGRIAVLASNRTEWANLKLSFEEDRRNTIRQLKKEERKLIERYEQEDRAFKAAIEVVKAREEEIEILERAEKDYAERNRATIEKLTAMKHEADGLEDRRQELANERKRLQKNPKECPTCGSRMDEVHFLEENARILKKQAKIRERLAELVAEGDELVRKDPKPQLDRMRERLICRRQELKQYEKEAQNAKNWRGNAAHDVERTRKDILDWETRTNPYPEKLKRTKREIEETKQRIEDITKQKNEQQEKQQQYAEWAKLFKDLRLWLIEDAVQELQQEIENSLMQLGLQDWKIECVVEKTTDKGKVQRGFEVLIRSPQSNDKLIPWKSVSGGETQRLRIASARGFQSLVRNRTGQRFNIEVWDEPTAHVAEEGLTDLLNFFEGIVRDEKRTLYLIDHRTLRAGNFDGGVRIVNTENGSVIRIQETV